MASDDLEVPPGVEAVGEFDMTPFGRARQLWWPAIYDNIRASEGYEGQRNTVRVTALQGAGGQIDMFGVQIDVDGEFADGEALLIAAAITDAKSSIDRARKDLGLEPH
jgi:hypothetical protein